MARRIEWGEDENDNVQYWLGYQQDRAAGRPITTTGAVNRPAPARTRTTESREQAISRIKQTIYSTEKMCSWMGWTDADRAKVAELQAQLAELA